MNYGQFKKVAVYAAKKAGDEALKLYLDRNFCVKFKSRHEIVTSADKISEKHIIGLIKKNFKEHKIISEEAGSNHHYSDFVWVVDPIDGTTNFYMHNPMFCVSIGLWHKNEIVLGVIYAPYMKELYWSIKGKGAFVGNKKLQVARHRNLNSSILTFCHGSTQGDIKRAVSFYNYFKLKKFDIRQLGSAALELAYVAAGYTDSIMIPGAHSWDVSAGVLMVREAGGKVTDFKGKEWNLQSKDMAASNGKIHKQLIQIVKNY